jgi:hypothetical protein
LYAGLLEWTGVKAPVTVAGGGLEVRRLDSGNDRLVFLFNHGAAAATSSVTVRLDGPAGAVTDLVSGEAVGVKATPDGLEWQGTIPPRDVRVLLVRPR